MLHRIRTAMNTKSFLKMGGPVEVDEAYIGGAPGNKHLSVRKKNAFVEGGDGLMVPNPKYRYNNRATKDNPLDDSDRFMLATSQIVGKRLTYAELTGKGKTEAF